MSKVVKNLGFDVPYSMIGTEPVDRFLPLPYAYIIDLLVKFGNQTVGFLALVLEIQKPDFFLNNGFCLFCLFFPHLEGPFTYDPEVVDIAEFDIFKLCNGFFDIPGVCDIDKKELSFPALHGFFNNFPREYIMGSSGTADNDISAR